MRKPNMKSFLTDCPLFLVLHGNSPTVWKQQHEVSQQWELPRLPFLRIRPETSIIGHTESVTVPSDCVLSFGVELGVVIGKDAKDVSREEALDYVAGYTCVNDLYSQIYRSRFSEDGSMYERHSEATLGKAVDGCGGIGPRLRSKEDIPDPYNLLTYAYCDGKRVDRAYTGSYLIRTEYLIPYLSRFMTLPAGTVISMGAAGWDGMKAEFPGKPGRSTVLEVEIESVGRMKNVLLTGPCMRDFYQSPFLAQRGKDNFNISSDHLWRLRGNYGNCDVVERIPVPGHMCPHLFPSKSIAGPDCPVIIPPHAATITCACELAGVIGPEPVYRVSRERASEYFAGYAVILSFHDSSLIEPIRYSTCYEQRAAYFLGGCGDGFYKISEIVPPGEVSNFYNRVMKVCLGKHSVGTNSGDYIRQLDEMLSLISQGITLLPGDVLSLGPAGERLAVSESEKGDFRISASISGLGGIETEVIDQRNPERKDKGLR